MDEESVPEQKKEPLNTLAEKLAAAIQKWREADKGAMQRKQLGSARKAIREARRERNETRGTLHHALDDSLYRYQTLHAKDVKLAAEVIGHAGDRNMLHTYRRQNEFDGTSEKVEVAAVKRHEELSNRPAVRASKKHRNKGMSGPSI